VQHPNHTYTAAGVYTVSLTVSGPSGSDVLSRANYVVVELPPDSDSAPIEAAFAASPLSGEAPLSVVFTNTSASGYITSYWRFGDGETSTVQHPSHTYTAAGVYTVSLTVSGPGGADVLVLVNAVTVNAPFAESELNLVYLPVILK